MTLNNSSEIYIWNYCVTNHEHMEILKSFLTGMLLNLKREWSRDFLGGPVVKLSFYCRGGTGSIPGWGTKILHATRHGQKNKNKFKK